MSIKLFISIILVCLLGSVVLAEPSGPKVTKLGNGLTVILEEDHTVDLVGIDVWIKAGSGAETEKLSGLSHMIEHLVFGATTKRQAGEMDIEMESIGATLDARTARDWAHFSATIAPRYLPKALDVFADVVFNALFKQEDIDRERMVILDELAKKRTQPFKLCEDFLSKELYGAHPYALPIEGITSTLKTITRDDILAHHRKLYVPGNMVVVVVGDIDSQQTISLIGKAFQGNASAPVPAQSYPAITPPEKQVSKYIKEPYKYAYLAMGFLGPRGADYTDVCAVDVLMTYFGMGNRSWMWTTLKGKMALADDTTAQFLTQKEPSLISIMAATTEANTDKAKTAILDKIAELRKQGISDADLVMAKRSLLGDFAFQNETYGGRASSYGFYFAVSDPDFASKYASNIQGITNADIIKVAQKYLDPDHAVMLTLGPGQEVAK